MRGNLNTQFWLDNDTKHLENAFTRIFYKLTRGSAPRQFYKKYLYKAFSKYNLAAIWHRYLSTIDISSSMLCSYVFEVLSSCFRVLI